MQYGQPITLLLGFLVTKAYCALLIAPIPGYGVEEIQWVVKPSPGAATVNLTGTVQQVHAKLLEINPNFETDFSSIANPTIDGLQERSWLDKRFGPVCDGTWPATLTENIQSGISYLRNVPGQPGEGPGPGACGRVSCSYNGAIWWCNDNTTPFSLPSFSTIADCAQVIVNTPGCRYTDGFGEDVVAGQNFNGFNWNCIVRYNSC